MVEIIPRIALRMAPTIAWKKQRPTLSKRALKAAPTLMESITRKRLHRHKFSACLLNG
jgi:hypothetical protein